MTTDVEQKRDTRYILEISKDGKEWIPIHLVLPFKSNYGWQKEEAERYQNMVNTGIPEVRLGHFRTRIREEKVDQVGWVERVTPVDPKRVVKAKDDKKRRPGRKRLQRDTPKSS